MLEKMRLEEWVGRKGELRKDGWCWQGGRDAD